MSASIDTMMKAALGPLPGSLGTPVATKPAVGQGIFNNTVGAAASLVLQGNAQNGLPVPQGKIRRIKIANPSAAMLAYTYQAAGASAPTMTAGTVGAATDGSPVPPGSFEWIELDDDRDLYLAAASAATPYSLTVVEQPA